MTIEQIIKKVDKVREDLVRRYPEDIDAIDLTASMVIYEIRKGEKL